MNWVLRFKNMWLRRLRGEMEADCLFFPSLSLLSLRIPFSTRLCTTRHRRLCWLIKERSEWDPVFRQMYLKCYKRVCNASYCRYIVPGNQLCLSTFIPTGTTVACLCSVDKKVSIFSNNFWVYRCDLTLCIHVPVLSLRYLLCCFAGEPDDRDQSKLEEKLWDPECPLTNKQIDQFLVVAR